MRQLLNLADFTLYCSHKSSTNHQETRAQDFLTFLAFTHEIFSQSQLVLQTNLWICQNLILINFVKYLHINLKALNWTWKNFEIHGNSLVLPSGCGVAAGDLACAQQASTSSSRENPIPFDNCYVHIFQCTILRKYRIFFNLLLDILTCVANWKLVIMLMI